MIYTIVRGLIFAGQSARNFFEKWVDKFWKTDSTHNRFNPRITYLLSLVGSGFVSNFYCSTGGHFCHMNQMHQAEESLGLYEILNIMNHHRSIFRAANHLRTMGYDVTYDMMRRWINERNIRLQYVKMPDNPNKSKE